MLIVEQLFEDFTLLSIGMMFESNSLSIST